MIKLVVFDWNGTLLADTQAVLEGVERELAVLGHPPMTMGEFRTYYDMPITKLYQHFGISEEELRAKSAETAAAFHGFYEPRVAKARTRTGAKQVLETLAKEKISMVILSNHTVEGIYLQLARLKLTNFFEAVLANEIVGAAYFKGKQDRLDDYLKLHKLLPKEVVIVGDTIEEIKIGKRLGLKTVAITGGYNSTKRLKASKPDVLIHKLRDLIDVSEGLNG